MEEEFFNSILKEKDEYIAFQRFHYERLKEKNKANEEKVINQRNEIKELNKKIEELKIQMDERMALEMEKDDFILERESRLTKITRLYSESLRYIQLLENQFRTKVINK